MKRKLFVRLWSEERFVNIIVRVLTYRIVSKIGKIATRADSTVFGKGQCMKQKTKELENYRSKQKSDKNGWTSIEDVKKKFNIKDD